jgi:hypothetical protein
MRVTNVEKLTPSIHKTYDAESAQRKEDRCKEVNKIEERLK